MKLEAPSLALGPGLAHGFFTREGGVSDGLYASLNCGQGSRDDAGRVSENRARVAAVLHVGADRLLSAHQVHSPRAILAEGAWSGARPEADAVVTRTRGVAVSVLTADCVPVLLADAEAGVIGAAHAGWNGALSGVLEATLDLMQATGAEKGRIRAAIGPSISGAAYEVGEDFAARFLAADPQNRRFFEAGRPGHAYFDLPAYVAARLGAAGIGGVERLERCTFGEEARFFSYRRATHRSEADYGRQISAIALL